jgi:cytochrome c5
MRLASALLGSVFVLAASSVVLAAAAGDAAPQAVKPAAQAAATPAAPGDEAAQYKALVQRYCVSCHNSRMKSGDLALHDLDFNATEGEGAAKLERVVRKLRGRMMPPPGAARPDDALTGRFVDFMEGHLDAAAAKNPDPGHVALHRLNRKEYANAVRDLFDLEVDPATLLPQDDTSDSFDNIADVLQVSPAFLDQYISAARSVAIQAVGDLRMKPSIVSLKPPPGVNQKAHIAGLPLGTRGGMVLDYVFPADGEYELTFTGSVMAAYDDPLRDDRFLVLVDGKVVYDSAKAAETSDPKAPAGSFRGRKTTVKVKLTGGKHKIGGAYTATTFLAPIQQLSPLTPSAGIEGPTVVNLDIAGPINPVQVGHSPSRDAIFVCRPAKPAQEEACARKILANVAHRAFRRPLTDADLAAPMKFYAAGRKQGGFDAGIQQGLMAILASPKFLYRTTTPPKGATANMVYAVNDIDLASRLSFFLWSSLPDTRLLKLAEQKKLSQPKVLDAEVRRMLADPRSESLTTNFAFQWLQLGAVNTMEPDPTIFPDFDQPLRAAFQEEMRLFMDSVLREDRSVVDLLTARHTFVNERLARHYGIPNVTGNRFRRVELTDSNRFGLLGKGAVLMATSYPNRTAPVIRGAWLLENMFGTPPTPPPPSVGGIADNVPGQKALTVRALMEIHRSQATCNACHGVMDPLGLSLENFDAIGAWRNKDRMASEVIDASATMVNGDKMNGVADLRGQILKREEQFVRTFAQKLMTFGVGRSMEYRDMPTVRAIVRDAAKDNYKFSTLVMGIVHSDQFRKSKVPGPETPTKVAETPPTKVATAAR